MTSYNSKILANLHKTLSTTIPSIRNDIEEFVSNPDAVESLENAYCNIQPIVDVAEMLGLEDLQKLSLHVKEMIEHIASSDPGDRYDIKDYIFQVINQIEPCCHSLHFNTEKEDVYLKNNSDEPQSVSDHLGENYDNNFKINAKVDNSYNNDLVTVPISFSSSFYDAVTDSENEQNNFDMDFTQELFEGFIAEAEEYLDTISKFLPNIKNAAKNNEDLLQVRRSVHTLKGSAGIVGLLDVSDLAHRMEDMLDKLYDGSISYIGQIENLLYETFDVIEDFIRNKRAIGNINHLTKNILGQYDELFFQLDCHDYNTPSDLVDKKSESTAGFTDHPEDNDAKVDEQSTEIGNHTDQDINVSTDTIRVSASKIDKLITLVSDLTINNSVSKQVIHQLLKQIDELHLSINRLQKSSTDIETQYELNTSTKNRNKDLANQNKLNNNKKSEWTGLLEFDELELDRYNDFYIVSRDLSETTADISVLGHDFQETLSVFDNNHDRQVRIISDIQHQLMQFRMVPFSTFSSRLNRIVRVTSKQRNKNVLFLITGEEVQFDKVMLDQLNEILMHLLRNAVDHGIENTETRIAIGKPQAGQINLSVIRQGSQLIVRLTDDGRGLDVERIRDTALQNGLITKAEASSWDANQLYPLIFSPGFSTAHEVSEVSGRGVGMDIVQSTVEHLKGKLQIHSNPGQGTTFTIFLPLNLAMANVLLVKNANQFFAFQLSEVIEILRIESSSIESRDEARFIQYANQALPIFRLEESLNNFKSEKHCDGFLTVVIIEVNNKKTAFIVDHVLGSQEVVLKDLGSHLSYVKGLAGSTILGDGTIVLVLNPSDFYNYRNILVPQNFCAPITPQSVIDSYRIMIVDDSFSVRRVVANLIKSMNWEPILAKNGLEALNMLQTMSDPPDLMLLDVEMPQMNGYELTSTLRSQEAFKILPIIMLTSRSGEKHRRKAYEIGTTEYLIKPYQDSFLVNMINSLIIKARSISAA